jgi:hypothetical protein
MNGYIMRIYRGETPAPEVDRWGRLGIDGLKLMIVGLIWSIPILVIWMFTYGSLVGAILSGNLRSLASTHWTPNMGLVLLMYLFEIVIGILLPVASIRFARTNLFSEAFNFRAIVDHIGRIGWLGYILGLIIVAIIVAVPIMAVVCIFVLLGIMAGLITGSSLAAILGTIIVAVLVILLISPVFVVFQARYWTRLYDSAVPAAE